MAATPNHARTALITGITGQDGSYLAEFLLAKGYEVFGLVRRLSTPNINRIHHIQDNVTLIYADLLDQSSLERAISFCNPDEVYNLAAMSHVGISFSQPVATGVYNGLGTIKLLEAVRNCGKKTVRFYQASTSELFGQVTESPQNEQTRFAPRSPYGISKLYAHASVVNYRDAYNLYAVNGILFNHESPRRGFDFVTRKITSGVARIKYGQQQTLSLGNLNAYRDWGYAGDYVEAMWLMLQQSAPQDYVIATGETHSIGEFVALACEYAELPGMWHSYIDIDPALYRPADVELLCGDASKARSELGWQPKVDFRQLVQLMTESDLQINAPSYERKEESSCQHYQTKLMNSLPTS